MLPVFVKPVLAGIERYDYDPLGRLTRVIDEQGRMTEYLYDGAGNIVEVRTSKPDTIEPPVITSVTPLALRRGTTIEVTVTGRSFLGATVISPEPALSIGSVQVTATSIEFTLSAAPTATLGDRQFRLVSAAGSTPFTLRVDPLLPKLEVSPSPLAVPPDRSARSFAIRLSNTDTIAHQISIASSNASVFTVSPETVTIPAGSSQAVAAVRGISNGTAFLQLTSPTLGSVQVPVFVTAEFAGITTSYASEVGVLREAVPRRTETPVTPVASPIVGLAKGRFIERVEPTTLSAGGAAQALRVVGAGLEGVTGIRLEPAAGVTLGTPTVAADGRSITTNATVQEGAAVGQRRVVLTGPVPYPPASPMADRVTIVAGRPVITSLDPIVVVPDGTPIALTIRGRNLQSVESVIVTPAAGIVPSSTLSINPSGTEIRVLLAIASNVALGQKVVSVRAPASTSDATPSVSNTFTLVETAGDIVTPVTSAVVGVEKAFTRPPTPEQPVPILSSVVGVTRGSVVTTLAPNEAITGTSVTLNVQGIALGSVNKVEFNPPTGITVRSVTPDSAGNNVQVALDIAGDAPKSSRAVNVIAGTTVVPFVTADAAQFRVVAPAPIVESVDPITLEVAAPAVTFTIRGRNFFGASAPRFLPAAGVEVQSVPTIDAAGTTLTVSVRALVGAAPGPRVVVVPGPGGTSPATPSAANTVTLVSANGPRVTPLTSAVVGVDRTRPPQPPKTDDTNTISPIVGVLRNALPLPPATVERFVASTVIGVLVGPAPPTLLPRFAASPMLSVAKAPVALSIEVPFLARGVSAVLRVRGLGLSGVTSLALPGSSGVTLGAVTVAPDGNSLTAPITIAAPAPASVSQLIVKAGTARIAFVDPGAARVTVNTGFPRIDSISPIVLTRGETVTMTVRGANLHNVDTITVAPSTGVSLSSSRSVNAGTEITFAVAVDTAATLGPYVLRVHVPGASTPPEGTEVNTFTVFPSNSATPTP